MAHISSFNKFKLMLENNNINYINSQSINEEGKLKDNHSGNKILGGNKVSPVFNYPGIKGAYDIALAFIEANTNDAAIKQAKEAWVDILNLDKDIYPEWFIGTNPVNWKSKNYLALQYAVSAGHNAGSGVSKKFLEKDEWGIKQKVMEKRSIEDIVAVPVDDNFGIVYTIGNPTRTSKEVEGTDQTSSSYKKTKLYMNCFNTVAAIQGGDLYGSENQLTENGYLNLLEAAGSGGQLTIFVDTKKEKGTVEKSEETETKRVGYEPALEGKADIAFKNSSYNISDDPQGQTKIDALAKVIAEKFEGKTFDTFNLISSASPVWGGKETMADYAGKPTEGTGDPGEGNDFATKNYKLAYNRGLAIMKALNVSLKNLGHAGIPNYTITWQISDKGGPENTGRYVDLRITSKENQGKEVTTTKVSGKVTKEKSRTTGQAIFYAYECL